MTAGDDDGDGDGDRGALSASSCAPVAQAVFAAKGRSTLRQLMATFRLRCARSEVEVVNISPGVCGFAISPECRREPAPASMKPVTAAHAGATESKVSLTRRRRWCLHDNRSW
jgi:hypothetical protein